MEIIVSHMSDASSSLLMLLLHARRGFGLQESVYMRWGCAMADLRAGGWGVVREGLLAELGYGFAYGCSRCIYSWDGRYLCCEMGVSLMEGDK